jgi:pimeloyl-ACP methyl ester carboxylesterase
MMQVLLVHGIWNPRAWLLPLALRLRAAGLQPQLFGYRSVCASPEQAVAALMARIRTRGGAPVVVVGYSLGGLITLEAVRRGAAVERVVCLGSPLLGSASAAALSRHRASGWLLGRSRELLNRGVAAWDGGVPVGMIAGSRAHGVGRLLADLGDSDGTVAVAETRLPGLADHCVLAASHSGLVLSAAVARQTVAFLRDGHFARS